MPFGDGQVIVCIVPPHRADDLLEPLREHYLGDPRVVVIADRRVGERRASRDDLTTAEGRAERRSGGNRRRPVLPRTFATPPWQLPGMDEVAFVQRLVPVGDDLGDASDAVVVARARAGDPHAPAELYWRYYERVHSRLSVLLGDVADVHAAVAPAFGRILDELEDPASADVEFEALLYAAVEASVADRLPPAPVVPGFVADLGPSLEIADETLDEPVVVSERDPRWFHRGLGERDRLMRQLRELDVEIEHVGSTAVPSIAARPIIDLAIAIADRRSEADVRAVLRDLGYEDCGTAGTPGRAYMRRRGVSRYDVHIVHRDGVLWRDVIAVRDFLRRHPAEAHRWAAVKREAARGAATSAARYFERRREAMAELTVRARATGGDRAAGRVGA